MTTFIKILLPLIFLPILGITPRPHSVDRGLINVRRAEEFESYLDISQNLLQVIEYYPWRLDLIEKAGQYAIQGGDPKNGVELLHAVALSKNLTHSSHMALGEAALQQSDPHLAIDAWQAALHAGGNPPVIYPRLYQAHRTLGDIEAAIEDLQIISTLQPSNAWVNHQLGLLFATKDPDTALAYLSRAVELNPDLESTVQPIRRRIRTARLSNNPAYTLLISGRELAALEEWDLAERAFQQAAQLRPDYAEAWAFLAEAKQHSSTPDDYGNQVFELLDKALQLDPESVAANTLVALYWQRQGRYDLALVYLHAAVHLEPDNPTLLLELGNTLAQMGEITPAQKYYQQAAELAPHDPIYWHALAAFTVNYELEVRQVGLPAARQALVLNPNDPASLDVMGQVFTLLNDPNSAKRFLTRALQQDPGFAPARLHLGLLHLILGETSAAREQISLAQTLAQPGTPTSLQANRLLQRYFP